MRARLRGLRALVFDFDGTLVDASIPICRAFNAALTRHGVPPMEETAIRRLIGQPLRDMFAGVLPGRRTEEIEVLIDAYRDAFLPISIELSKPMPGLRRLLDHCRPRYKLAIATSRMSDGADRILRAMHLRDRFEAIIGLEHVGRAKPDPEPVRQALDRLGVPPAQAMMIGDVPDDMRSGKAAGALAAGLASELHSAEALTAAGADFVIGGLPELIALLAHLSHQDAPRPCVVGVEHCIDEDVEPP